MTTLDAVVDDLLARYGAHQIREDVTGTYLRPQIAMACSCGWLSGFTSATYPPQREAVDGHLIADVLPQWPTGTCWCGRVVLLSPLGRWFHAAQGTHGHDADPSHAAGRTA